MQKFILGALTLSTAAWIGGEAWAHGGTYRGPGDTVPPGAGSPPPAGGPPTTGSPQGPAPQAPTGPTTPVGGGPPVPGAPPGGGGPTTPGGGYETQADLTLWSFWWEFNKDPFINLKAAIHSNAPSTGSGDFFLGDGEKEDAKDTLKPSAAQIRGTIVPALLHALETESNNDIVTGCLIALAKIGDEPGEDGRSQFSEVIGSFLSDSNQEISETAALSLGILANPSGDNLKRLVGLMTDSKYGREARGSTEQAVPLRTRAFASYGLGLVGYRVAEPEVRSLIVQEFANALIPAEREATQDIATAIVISMGLVPLEPEGDSAESTKELIEADIDPAAPGTIDSLEDQIALLSAVFDDLRLDRFMRAHIPTALGRMLESLEGRDDMAQQRRAIKRHVADMLLLPLDPRKGGKFEEEVQQSCSLALGLVGDADQDEVDVEIRKVLLDAYKDQQRQAKNFALIALSKIAARRGEEMDAEGQPRSEKDRFVAAREDVVKHMTKRLKSGRSGEEHYAGLGIGVLSWLLRDAGETLSSESVESIGLLHSELDDARAVEDIGAFSVASGLAGSEDAKASLQRLLVKTQEPIARGYVALALGMLNIRESQEMIRNIVVGSQYKPDLLKQAAIALGLLGDKDTVDGLIQMLQDSDSLATQASLASALGFIGDRRSVDPLVEMLKNATLTETARGFAAVALGIVADKEPLPWNSKIGVDLNYRASLETLNTQDGKGVLNIL